MTIATSTRTPEAVDPAGLPSPQPLAPGAGVSLFLDFDGTLVDIADRPQDVVVAPGLPDALAKLATRLNGRLAVVSGRSLAVLDELLRGAPIAMAGSHGGEFRPAGTTQAEALAPPLPLPACKALEAYAREHDLVFEAKPCSAAIHYRLHPDVGDALFAFASRLGSQHGIHVKHGKMVVELTMPGSDKGNAVTRFMQMAPFAGTHPLFVGDDVTDEDAFAAVRRFDGGGVLVGAPRQTEALWRLPDVAAVHRWLEEYA